MSYIQHIRAYNVLYTTHMLPFPDKMALYMSPFSRQNGAIYVALQPALRTAYDVRNTNHTGKMQCQLH